MSMMEGLILSIRPLILDIGALTSIIYNATYDRISSSKFAAQGSLLMVFSSPSATTSAFRNADQKADYKLLVLPPLMSRIRKNRSPKRQIMLKTKIRLPNHVVGATMVKSNLNITRPKNMKGTYMVEQMCTKANSWTEESMEM